MKSKRAASVAVSWTAPIEQPRIALRDTTPESELFSEIEFKNVFTLETVGNFVAS
jgi:hypothetical protein